MIQPNSRNPRLKINWPSSSILGNLLQFGNRTLMHQSYPRRHNPSTLQGGNRDVILDSEHDDLSCYVEKYFCRKCLSNAYKYLQMLYSECVL